MTAGYTPRWAYMLDGVLAVPPSRSLYSSADTSTLASYYATARVLWPPLVRPALIITERTDHYTTASRCWLADHGFDDVTLMVLSAAHSALQMAQQALGGLQEYAIQHFVSADRNVLNNMRRIMETAPLAARPALWRLQPDLQLKQVHLRRVPK